MILWSPGARRDAAALELAAEARYANRPFAASDVLGGIAGDAQPFITTSQDPRHRVLV